MSGMNRGSPSDKLLLMDGAKGKGQGNSPDFQLWS